MQTRQALLLAAVITFSSPHFSANAQISQGGLDSLFTIGESLFGGSSNKNTSKGGTFQQKVEIDPGSIAGTADDITIDPGTVTDPSAIDPTGNVSVSADNPFDDTPQSSFVKDIFLGVDPTGQREVSSTTIKFLDYLGKAQKAYKTYQVARGAYNAFLGKNADGVIQGAENILKLYGVINPNAAVAIAAANRSVGPISATIANAQVQRIKELAYGGKPQTAYGVYYKGKNNQILRSDAAQEATRLVHSKQGQELIEAQEQFSLEAVKATTDAMGTAAITALRTERIAYDNQAYGTFAEAEAGKAQSVNSSQKVLKHNANIAAAGIQQNAGISQQLSGINQNQTAIVYGISQQVGMASVANDKMTILQSLFASNLDINSSAVARLRAQEDREINDRVRHKLNAWKSFDSVYLLTDQPRQGQPTPTAQQP